MTGYFGIHALQWKGMCTAKGTAGTFLKCELVHTQSENLNLQSGINIVSKEIDHTQTGPEEPLADASGIQNPFSRRGMFKGLAALAASLALPGATSAHLAGLHRHRRHGQRVLRFAHLTD